jgi:hypothetical protein
MQHPGNVGSFFVFPQDVANGFSLEILSFATVAKCSVILALISSAALHFRVGGTQTQASAVINHWPVQDASYVLRRKLQRPPNF